MKRLCCILLVVLLLCGCSAQPPEETASTALPSHYVPDSPLEQATDGAIRSFCLGNAGCLDYALQDEYVMLFTGRGIHLLEGDELTSVGILSLKEPVSSHSTSLLLDERGLVYYNEANNQLVYHSLLLQEEKRLTLPEQVQGIPVLSQDRSRVFYASEDGIRVLDLNNGISQLLAAIPGGELIPEGLYRQDSLLRCRLVPESGEPEIYYIHTQTGQIHSIPVGISELEVWDNGFLYRAQSDQDDPYLFGATEEPTGALNLPLDIISWQLLPELDSVLTIVPADSDTELSLYRLSDGLCWAKVLLDEVDPSAFRVNKGNIWFLSTDSGDQFLHCWDPSMSVFEEDAVYTTPYYTREQPDTAGLEALQQKANTIAEAYGVQILLWDQATEYRSDEMNPVSEYRTQTLNTMLIGVENALSKYPEGFLKACIGSNENPLTILLLRDLGLPSHKSSFQFYQDGNVYIAISGLSFPEGDLHEGLYHLIDSRVLNECVTFDAWNSLNPSGFSYQAEAPDLSLTHGNAACFVDVDSMQSVVEDRASIFRYAMTSSSFADLNTEPLQMKLQVLCEGIREAFELQDYEGVLPWEMHLADN